MNIEPKSCLELLKIFDEKENKSFGTKIHFEGIHDSYVFNITAPFQVGDKIVIAGRVEEKKPKSKSRIIFFEEIDGKWNPINNAPIFDLEDGFATKIGSEIIFGGVEIYYHPSLFHLLNHDYRTAFYRGHDLSSLTKFTHGPTIMKDIRLIELKDGSIAVFTRPLGGNNYGGRIGFKRISNLNELNIKNIQSAKVIENQFIKDEWGGTNNLHLLPDDKIGVIGHIAQLDELERKHYYVTSFIYNPETHYASQIKIIARRSTFHIGEIRAPELADILYPGGLIRNGDGTATLYAGLSDSEAGKVDIPDPFL